MGSRCQPIPIWKISALPTIVVPRRDQLDRRKLGRMTGKTRFLDGVVHRPYGRQMPAIMAAVLCFALLPGCVQRRLTIRSDPPGALVYIDNYEIGTTPVSTDYLYYGTRQIRLVRDGFETLTVEQPIPPPWYEVFPVDFVADNLVPAEIRDERTLNFRLAPQRIVPTGQLRQRAEELREGSRAAAVSPALGPLSTPLPLLPPPAMQQSPLPPPRRY